jgi:RNA polymerase sigma factor (sigma-70 family)
VTAAVDEYVRATDDLEVTSFCQAVWPRLVGALSLSFGDLDVAEDLAQEALVRVVERWQRVREMANPDGYVFQIAFNLRRSWWRRRAAESRANARAGTSGDRIDVDNAQRIAVRDALCHLSPRQRQAVIYRFYVGFDVEETAFAMGCRPGTVKALTSQAVGTLRAAGLGVDDE